MRGFNRYTPEEIRYLKDHAGLLPVKVIARHLHRPEKSVYRKAYALAIPVLCLNISEQEAGWIMELSRDGMPVEQVAEKFGLPRHSLNLFIEFRRRELLWP